MSGLDYLFELLAEYPEMGGLWSNKVRRHPYRSHVVYYRIRKKDILILRIRSAKQKTPKR